MTPSRIEPIMEWVKTHLILIIILVAAVILIMAIIWMVLIYFSSRFTFVYLDGVVKNDLQVKHAYRENRLIGWSYFLWRIIFVPTALLGMVIVIGLPVLGLVLWAKDKGFTIPIIILLVLTGLLLIILLIILGIISWLTDDLVVPIMYLLKIKVMKGWRVLLELLAFNKTPIFLYLVMKFVLGLAAGMLLLIPCCCLVCFAIAPALLIVGLVVLALKYPLVWVAVGLLGIAIMFITSIAWHTIITPITVFFRTYSLVFLEGFGNEFASITQPIPSATGVTHASSAGRR